MDAKPKFRARKLEPNKQLKILRYDELDAEDAEELLAPASMRAAVVISTGVDKEEEEEEHLQAALTTAMVAPKDQQYVIPVPDAQPVVADYELLYPTTFKLPKSTYLKAAIKVRTGDLLDNQLPPLQERPSRYDVNQEDDRFCRDNRIDINVFEVVMEWCDMVVRQTSVNAVTLSNLRECLPWLPADCDDQRLTRCLEYYKEHADRLVVNLLKHEDIGKIGADPYVCFRRRELKQPRKTRRSDAQCIDRIRRLRYELETIATAMSVAIKRDQWRLQSLLLESALFEEYARVDEWRQMGVKLPESFGDQMPSYKQAIAPPTPILQQPLTISNSSTSNRHSKKRQSRKSTTTSTHSTPDTAQPQRYKISLPAAAFKSLKYSRPYYPIEMLKLLQRDLDGIQADLQPHEEDLMPSLWKQTVLCDEADSLYYRRCPDDLPTTGKGVPGAIRARRGRLGRLLFDHQPDYRRVLIAGDQIDSNSNNSNIKDDLATRLSMLSLKECAQLNNQSIGNYNHHYIQNTVHLTRPYTFFGWLTATSGLQAAANTKAPRSHSNSRQSSPRKPIAGTSPMVPNPTNPNPNSGNSQSSSQPPQTPNTNNTTSTSNKSPNSLGNIIVKVKKTGLAQEPTTPPGSQPQAKRFTPNGLSPGE